MAAKLIITPWQRRHRRIIDRWPAMPWPAHWSETDRPTGRRQSWAVELDGVLIGRLSLREITIHQARIGTYLHPEWVGRGVGRQALFVWIAMLQLPKLVLDVAADNERAIRCYRAVGFVDSGSFSRGEHEFLEMHYGHSTIPTDA